MQAQIDELKVKLDRVSGRLRDAEQVRSEAKAQLTDIRKQISRLLFKKRLYWIAAWNKKRSIADPIWNLALPLSVVAAFTIVIFAPVWFFTGSIAFATICFLFFSVVTTCGFLTINMAHFSNPQTKLSSLTTRVDAAHSIRDSRIKHYKSCQNTVNTIKQERSKIGARLAELTTSIAYEKELQINSLLSQEWRLLRGVPWEEFLMQLLECHGFEAEMTPASGDQGVDLVAKKYGISIAIQAKGYANNVGNAAVQQAYTGMAIYGCTHCAVITNSEFTSAAQIAAGKTGCILIGCSDIPALAYGTLESIYSLVGNYSTPRPNPVSRGNRWF